MVAYRRIAVTLGLAMMISLLLSGCRAGPKLEGDTVATVNGQTISQADLDVRIKIMELFFQQKLEDPASKQQILDTLIEDALIRGKAEEFGVTVTDEDVEAEMARFFGALDRQYETRAAVDAKLQELALTNEHLASFLHNYLVSQGVIEGVRSRVTVTDEEVTAYYGENRDAQYTFKEDAVRAAHILVPLDQEAKAGEISAKAKSGGDFAELARLYSVDPGSGKRGGELGYFTKGAMVKEFADAAFAMQPGEISDPVQSEYGWHVIFVIDRAGPGVLPLEKARPDVLNRLLPQKQEQALQQWLQDLTAKAQIEKKTFTEPGAKQ